MLLLPSRTDDLVLVSLEVGLGDDVTSSEPHFLLCRSRCCLPESSNFASPFSLEVAEEEEDPNPFAEEGLLFLAIESLPVKDEGEYERGFGKVNSLGPPFCGYIGLCNFGILLNLDFGSIARRCSVSSLE